MLIDQTTYHHIAHEKDSRAVRNREGATKYLWDHFRRGNRNPPGKGNPFRSLPLSLCALLFSARISHRIALKAAIALAKQGWTTPERLVKSSWAARAGVLKRSGYSRYDERTSTMLGETAKLLLERYKGDLRKLREEADRNSARERELLKEFKGIGDVGVDIFFSRGASSLAGTVSLRGSDCAAVGKAPSAADQCPGVGGVRVTT
jgi:hypothetical protein